MALPHHLRLLVHIEGRRQFPSDDGKPHHRHLEFVAELLLEDGQTFSVEPMAVRAVEVRKFDQLHLPRLMRGPFIFEDFELAL